VNVGFHISTPESCRSANGHFRSVRFAPKYAIQSCNARPESGHAFSARGHGFIQHF
jgi:hypothetical protein